jgi:hypothetical protein
LAITTLDQVIAGAQPPVDCVKAGNTMEAVGALNMHSFFLNTGIPGAATQNATLNGAALTSLAGQIPYTNPPGGQNAYLSRVVVTANVAGLLKIYDRLWHNGGYTITTTGAQSTTFPGLPARDRSGTTDGDGVLIGLECSVATTNGANVTNTTISYTNQAGTAGRTGTMTAWPAGANAGTFVPFNLAAGDTGVRSVQSLSLGTSYVTGTVHLVAYRVLASIAVPTVGGAVEINAVTGGFPRLYDNTVPFALWAQTATAAVNVGFSMAVAWG